MVNIFETALSQKRRCATAGVYLTGVHPFRHDFPDLRSNDIKCSSLLLLVADSTMYAFTNRITRRTRNAYDGRIRPQKSEKIRELQEKIEDAIDDVGASTPMSEACDVASTKQCGDDKQWAAKSEQAPEAYMAETSLFNNDRARDSGPKSDEQIPKTSAEDWPQLPRPRSMQPLHPAGKSTLLPISSAGQDAEVDPAFWYVTFDGEDETDYTEGPPRMVRAHDGIRDACALLMTLDLLAKIRNAIQSQRVYNETEERTRRLDRVDAKFERELRMQIMRHKGQLRKIRNRETPEDAELATAEQELEKLEILMETTKGRRIGHDARLRTAAKNLRELQAEVGDYLEDAFVEALLIEPWIEEEPQSAIEELTVEGEYERLCRSLQEDGEGGDIEFEPLHKHELEVIVRSPEEQARLGLLQRCGVAARHLHEMQAAFNRRADDYDRAKLTTDQPPEVFDVEWLAHEQKLTRALIDAEAAEAEAKAAALEGGLRRCDIDPNASPTLVDGEQDMDGYPEGEMQQVLGSVARPRVSAWLAGVPSAEPSPALTVQSYTEEQGGNDADQVGLSDSLSMIAEGSERTMIDKWRKMCVFERREM